MVVEENESNRLLRERTKIDYPKIASRRGVQIDSIPEKTTRSPFSRT